jgi:predicted alpha/beta hydrolase family esterase
MDNSGILFPAAQHHRCRAMKAKDSDILFIPGLDGSGPAHWQTRWESKLSTGRRVHQADWSAPERARWTETLADAVNESERPVVLVAHSLGVAAAVQAVPLFRKRIAGAFFVAAPDLEAEPLAHEGLREFGPYPTAPLPFPSIFIASRNDPYSDLTKSEETAAGWGSLFIDAGEAGHLNTASGHGPWPEGSLVFAKFLSRLDA